MLWVLAKIFQTHEPAQGYSFRCDAVFYVVFSAVKCVIYRCDNVAMTTLPKEHDENTTQMNNRLLTKDSDINVITSNARNSVVTTMTERSHFFQVSLTTPQTLSHKSSLIPRTCYSWNVLPSSFPESFNLPSFKSNIDKLDLISLSC